MSRAPQHPHEEERLAAFRAMRLDGTPAEARFDRIARLARRALGARFAAVNLTGADHLWVKSSVGDEGDAMLYPADVSFCHHAVSVDEPLVVEDSLADPRFAGNPHAGFHRFYAGHPVHYQDMPVGVLCVSGPASRRLSDDDLETLRLLARMVEDELAISELSETQLELVAEVEKLRADARMDGLTRVWNRAGIIEIARRELARGRPLGFLLLDVDHFKQVNDSHGHQAGDQVLRVVAERIREGVRITDAVGRYGGEEFLIVMPHVVRADLEGVAERIRKTASRAPVLYGLERISITVSIGGAIGNETTDNIDQILRAADEALYLAKKSGRDRVCTRRITPSLSMRAVRTDGT